MHDHPCLVDSADEVEYVSEQAASLLCQVCSQVVSQPVQLACENLVCASCCRRWIQVSGGVSCPCCYNHRLDDDTITLPSVIVLDLLATLRLSSTKCSRTTTARQYRKHKESNCQGHYEETSPFLVTAERILQRPITAPTQPVERQVAAHLVRRLMSESGDSVLKIPTRGQVMVGSIPNSIGSQLVTILYPTYSR